MLASLVVAACGSPDPAPAQDEEPIATSAATASDSALAAAIQAGEEHAFSQLPPGAGREIVSEACLTCHGTAIIQMQRKTRDRWTRSVRQMVDWGATLSAEQEQVVIDYLADNFGREPGVKIGRAHV